MAAEWILVAVSLNTTVYLIHHYIILCLIDVHSQCCWWSETCWSYGNNTPGHCSHSRPHNCHNPGCQESVFSVRTNCC